MLFLDPNHILEIPANNNQYLHGKNHQNENEVALVEMTWHRWYSIYLITWYNGWKNYFINIAYVVEFCPKLFHHCALASIYHVIMNEKNYFVNMAMMITWHLKWILSESIRWLRDTLTSIWYVIIQNKLFCWHGIWCRILIEIVHQHPYIISSSIFHVITYCISSSMYHKLYF